MFLTSTRVPNGSVPRGRSETLASHAELATLHVGVGGADGPQEQLELLGVAAGLLGGAEVRLGHDLHERHARAIEVDQADPLAHRPLAVDQLRGVLLEVGPGDPDRERPVGRLEREPALGGERQVVLADLVALGQVRVEVVLAVPAGRVRGRRLDRGAGREDELDRPLVHHRQGAGQAQADGTGVAVGSGAVVRGRARAEHLRVGPELAVDLDADDGLVPFERGGDRGCAGGGHRRRVSHKDRGPGRAGYGALGFLEARGSVGGLGGFVAGFGRLASELAGFAARLRRRRLGPGLVVAALAAGLTPALIPPQASRSVPPGMASRRRRVASAPWLPAPPRRSPARPPRRGAARRAGPSPRPRAPGPASGSRPRRPSTTRTAAARDRAPRSSSRGCRGRCSAGAAGPRAAPARSRATPCGGSSPSCRRGSGT